MEAKDLMIGSLLEYYRENDKEWEERTITWSDLRHLTEYPDVFMKKWRPIPITEQRIRKLGLKLLSVANWQHGWLPDIKRIDKVYSTNVYDISDNEPKVEVDVIYGADESDLRRIGIRNCYLPGTHDIQYVHQFQDIIRISGVRIPDTDIED